jgi:hypothetical protein
MDVPTATAEHTIIAKLEWAKLGASDRPLDDVAGILRVRGADRRRTATPRRTMAGGDGSTGDTR